MQKLTFLESLQVENNIGRIKEIIDSQILSNAASINRSPLSECALIEFLIRLNDLLQKCKLLCITVDFCDDIPNGLNITDLVSKLRNSACHIPSNSRLLNNEIPFCFSIIGPGATAKYGSGIVNRYLDDIVFCYGNDIVYLKRHLIRAYLESMKKLKALPIDQPLKGYKGGSFGCCWI
ncbi:hypothetical protein COY60_02245 [Candidatus Gracilibacteria bacterium CG_4_10_14_0_8_um_filter_38_28]|nr:MAG: hypothetical protein COY60_02245 [Candidatus Gracilibacteria bacterium CG_4_10_14_0_8_um_filter_38_28]